MSDIDFLSIEDILELRADLIARYGGSDGIRDEGLLQSAVAQPQATFAGNYLYQAIMDFAIHRLDKQGLADLLRERAFPVS